MGPHPSDLGPNGHARAGQGPLAGGCGDGGDDKWSRVEQWKSIRGRDEWHRLSVDRRILSLGPQPSCSSVYALSLISRIYHARRLLHVPAVVFPLRLLFVYFPLVALRSSLLLSFALRLVIVALRMTIASHETKRCTRPAIISSPFSLLHPRFSRPPALAVPSAPQDDPAAVCWSVESMRRRSLTAKGRSGSRHHARYSPSPVTAACPCCPGLFRTASRDELERPALAVWFPLLPKAPAESMTRTPAGATRAAADAPSRVRSFGAAPALDVVVRLCLLRSFDTDTHALERPIEGPTDRQQPPFGRPSFNPVSTSSSPDDSASGHQ